MARKRLTARFVATVKNPGRYFDNLHGLMLLVRKTGGKSWVQRIVVNGRRRDFGLGSVDFVSLAEARDKAFENRKAVRLGGDPVSLAKVRAKPSGPTFAQAVDKVIAIQRSGWRDGAKSEAVWRQSLRDYAGPLMDRPVSAITTADILDCLLPVWDAKRETAKRTRGRISAVMRWAQAQGYRADDPAGAQLLQVLPKNGQRVKRQRSLPYSKVADAIRTITATDAGISTRLAFEFLVLTATRSGEVRAATWAEIDIDARLWRIPGKRTKTGKPHTVPLSGRALEILREAAEYADGTGLVFPSPRGKVLSDNTLSKLCRENGVQAVPHGFRGSFKTWATEQTDMPWEVVELALGHVVGSKVAAAYLRGDALDKRRALMADWADYLRK